MSQSLFHQEDPLQGWREPFPCFEDLQAGLFYVQGYLLGLLIYVCNGCQRWDVLGDCLYEMLGPSSLGAIRDNKLRVVRWRGDGRFKY